MKFNGFKNTFVFFVMFCSSFAVFADVNVYGPGGPAPAMKAAADAFSRNSGVKVTVVSGPAELWKDKAKDNADLIYSGSEAMMTDFESVFREQIIPGSVLPLYLRPAVILVRKGNPLKINGIKDLTKKDVRILVTHGAGQMGMWEDISGRTGDIETVKGIRKNIKLFASNTGMAKQAWMQNPDFDAWIVFNTWGNSDTKTGDIVDFEPEYRIYRDMGIAFTHAGEKKPEVERFVDFLKSAKGEEIFRSMGWSK
ncbi:solute-binding protein [Salmonella enterica]|nr:ABC transporter substrate-binding protein [Salmonella enterica subsp. enterica serovar Newport]EHI3123238.1 solute-binding protein [Salmonella enterica]